MERNESSRKAPTAKVNTPRRATKPIVPAPTNGTVVMTPEQRHALIAEAAYYRAQQRGFHGGDPVQDWLEAEAEIALRLSASHAPRPGMPSGKPLTRAVR